jgi:hypothetical protein
MFKKTIVTPNNTKKDYPFWHQHGFVGCHDDVPWWTCGHIVMCAHTIKQPIKNAHTITHPIINATINVLFWCIGRYQS